MPSPEQLPIVKVDDKGSVNPVSVICHDHGARCAGLYCLIRYLAENDEPITIFGLATLTRFSPEKTRAYVRALRDDGWIKVEGDLATGLRPTKAVDEEGIVYLLMAADRYKIGITDDLTRRVAQLNGGQSPFPIEEFYHVRTSGFRDLERILHERYARDRIHGEWFSFTLGTAHEIVSFMDDWVKDHR
jgi:hypothetical protein